MKKKNRNLKHPLIIMGGLLLLVFGLKSNAQKYEIKFGLVKNAVGSIDSV